MRADPSGPPRNSITFERDVDVRAVITYADLAIDCENPAIRSDVNRPATRETKRAEHAVGTCHALVRVAQNRDVDTCRCRELTLVSTVSQLAANMDASRPPSASFERPIDRHSRVHPAVKALGNQAITMTRPLSSERRYVRPSEAASAKSGAMSPAASSTRGALRSGASRFARAVPSADISAPVWRHAFTAILPPPDAPASIVILCTSSHPIGFSRCKLLVSMPHSSKMRILLAVPLSVALLVSAACSNGIGDATTGSPTAPSGPPQWVPRLSTRL